MVLVVFDRPTDLLFEVKEVKSEGVSEEAQRILEEIIEMGRREGFSVIVSIPWKLCSESIVSEQREENRKLSAELSQFCKVLDDPFFGVKSDWPLFADTFWHLSPKGSDERCQDIAKALAKIELEGDTSQ